MAHVQRKKLDFDVKLFYNLPKNYSEAMTDQWELLKAETKRVEIHLEEAVKASSQNILRGRQGAFGPPIQRGSRHAPTCLSCCWRR